jgi:hypothetical protein
MDRSEETGRTEGELAATLNWADRQKIPGCRQIVTKNGARWAKTKQIQKKRNPRYLAAGKVI